MAYAKHPVGFLWLILIVLVAGKPVVHRGSVPAMSIPQQVRIADGVFRGRVIRLEAFRDPRDGAIYTRAIMHVDEVFKGKLPAMAQLVHFGGALDGICVANGCTPHFEVGEERLLFVWRRHDGTLGAMFGESSAIKLERAEDIGTLGKSARRLVPAHAELVERVREAAQKTGAAGADLTDPAAVAAATRTLAVKSSGRSGIQNVTNFMTAPDGKAPRLITQDRGEPIPYLVDMTLLPAGISSNQALAVVSNALAAWAAVTSLKFTFAGLENFGMPAELIQTNDSRLRIQLYSYTNYIALRYGPSYLGIGGARFQWGLLSGAGWGLGGNVAGNEFHRIVFGSVMINHSNTALSVPSTFAEVLCHEIGHALGMVHSTDPQSIMYPTAHQDGRGAQLASTDVLVVRQAYPHLNTPPFVYPRVMDITTAPWPFSVPGINELELRGYDLQTTNPTVTVTNATSSNGQFTLSSPTLLRYSPSGYMSGPRYDPADIWYYDRIATRCYDGTNASPYEWVRVISFNPDTYPWGNPDGIPDAWMTTWFGNPNPAAGPKRGAYDDFDGDGLTNIQEYRAGMNPTNRASCQRIVVVGIDSISWQAMPYELYEIEYTASLNPAQWQAARIQVLPTAASATATGLSNVPGSVKFFRVKKVP